MSDERELELPPVMVRVRNRRGGACAIPLHTIPNPDPKTSELTPYVTRAYMFEGDTLVELDALNALPDGLQSQLIEWVNLGWLEMLPADLPPPAPAAEPVEAEPPLLPLDDERALALVKSTDDAAKLDAMFTAAGDRATVSEAILERLKELDRQ